MSTGYGFFDMEKKCSEENVGLFKEIHNRIAGIDRVASRITKSYICYDIVGGNRFCTLNPYKSKIVLYLDMGDFALIDPNGMSEFYSQSERNRNAKGRSSYRVIINNADDLDYLMDLVRQAYNMNGGVEE